MQPYLALWRISDQRVPSKPQMRAEKSQVFQPATLVTSRCAITFRNADEVVEFDERCEVPPHDERTSLDTELWIFGRYLRALAEASSLTYPLTATHAKQSESPDSRLACPKALKSASRRPRRAHRRRIACSSRVSGPKGKPFSL